MKNHYKKIIEENILKDIGDKIKNVKGKVQDTLRSRTIVKSYEVVKQQLRLAKKQININERMIYHTKEIIKLANEAPEIDVDAENKILKDNEASLVHYRWMVNNLEGIIGKMKKEYTSITGKKLK